MYTAMIIVIRTVMIMIIVRKVVMIVIVTTIGRTYI
jgi:hypothetical protein